MDGGQSVIANGSLLVVHRRIRFIGKVYDCVAEGSIRGGWKGLRGNQNISLTDTTEAEAAATEQRRLINLQMGIMGLKSSWTDGWVRGGGLWGV